MAITIHKILKTWTDPNHSDGSQVGIFILDDGSFKQKTILGGLPDNDADARTAILARGQELFDKGSKWTEPTVNIESAQKTFRNKIPRPAQVNGANSVPALRAVVADLVEAVQALEETI